MDNIRETALGLTIWYAFLAILCSLLLIILNDLDPPVALLAGANIALLFAFGLIMKARGLSEHSIMRGHFWHTLPAHDRPRGERGRRMVSSALQQTWLQFARGAAAVAIVLCVAAYMIHRSAEPAWAHSTPPQIDQTAD